jgi:hypothetical protein
VMARLNALQQSSRSMVLRRISRWRACGTKRQRSLARPRRRGAIRSWLAAPVELKFGGLLELTRWPCTEKIRWPSWQGRPAAHRLGSRSRTVVRNRCRPRGTQIPTPTCNAPLVRRGRASNAAAAFGRSSDGSRLKAVPGAVVHLNFGVCDTPSAHGTRPGAKSCVLLRLPRPNAPGAKSCVLPRSRRSNAAVHH